MTALSFAIIGTKVSAVRTAELPRRQVPNFTPTTFAQTIVVPSGDDVNDVIAGISDTTGNVLIQLAPDGSYTPFRLEKKAGTGHIVIETQPVTPTLGPLFPMDYTTGRTSPTYATAYHYATVTWTSGGFYQNAVQWNENPGSIPNQYTLRRFTVTAAAGSSMLSPLINLGQSAGIHSAADISELPTYMAAHQMYVKGIDATGVAGVPLGVRVGIGIDGHMMRVTGCFTTNIHYGEYGEDGIYDAQALRSFLGPGPAYVANNFLESNSECVALGGAGAISFDDLLVLADYTFEDNHIYKRLSWRSPAGESMTTAHANFRHGCKNGFEMKQGRRVWLRRNIIENIWDDQQHGTAFLITSINQYDGYPFLTSCDVTIEENWIKNCYSAVQVVKGYGPPYDTIPTERVNIRQNVTTGLRDPSLYSDAYSGDKNIGGILTLGNVKNVKLEHNTAFIAADSYTWMIETTNADTYLLEGWVVRDNILAIPNYANAQLWMNAYEISGHGFNPGVWSTSTTPSCLWDYNTGVDPQGYGASTHPSVGTHDTWGTTNAHLDLVNAARASDLACTLAQLSDLIPNVTSPAHLSASDGTDRGAAIATLQTLLATVRTPAADLPA